MKIVKSLCVAAGLLFAVSSTAQAANIVQVAKSTGKFDTLLAAAKAAGLVRTLSRGGPFTVFAPTDAAFARLPRGTVRSLLKRRNRGKLKAILLYHVVPGRVTSRKIRHGRSSARTLNGQRLHVRKNRHGVRVNGARVIAADVRADNGVIHVINRVLLPK